ncbi:PKD domain-containing protein [Candidatus Bathyarchaeota archaeon]|nr:PKD domain-containing protein [Candidatus Bathyarchaeota archaeon]
MTITLLSPIINVTHSPSIKANETAEQTNGFNEPNSNSHPTFQDSVRDAFPNFRAISSNSTFVNVTPDYITANLNQNFTIDVIISNVSDLSGFDIQFSWDPSLLEYVSHVAKVPVETYPDGVLCQPILPLMDDVDATAGTYWAAFATLGGPSFNGTGIAFEMTFHVIGSGSCLLEITSCDLANKYGQTITHSIQNGYFNTDVQMLPTDMPVVYVDPQNISASPGETFTISVKIFNLTDTIYACYDEWEPGQPLPPPDSLYVYTLGNLYALDIQLSWDPTILEHVDHAVKIPVETYPDGVLHEPIQHVMDYVDPSAGTYWLAKSSLGEVPGFNCQDANATVFTMTFNVTRRGKCTLNLTSVDLAADPAMLVSGTINKLAIPHWVRDGQFSYGVAGLPVANFEYYPLSPVVNEAVTFDASDSYDSDGYIILYVWDFGDGTIQNTTDPITYHSYTTPSSYDVTLQVIDDEGYSGFASASISVSGPMAYIRTYIPHEWVGGGSAMGWHADDSCWSYALPFSFPFYGTYYSTLYISSNGLISFTYDTSLGNSIEALAGKVAIAPAWDDWVTDGSYDIYIWQNSTCIGIRWYVRHYSSYEIANFEALLFSNGVIQFNYEYNSGDISATIGISNGYSEILAEDATNLNYINSILFTPFWLEHELLVYLSAPNHVLPGETAILNATVHNLGLSNETNVELYLLINGTVQANITLAELTSNSYQTLDYVWTPALEGTYNVTTYTPPVPNENITANNIATKMVNVRQVAGYVLVDQTHGTDGIHSYSIWVANLTEGGYVVETHTLGSITSNVLEGYDVFVIPQAHDYYSSDELSAIQDFVQNGGGLLVIGDDAPYVYTDLTSFAGITWISGGYGGYTSDITLHAVTDGVNMAYFDSPGMIYVTYPAIDLIRDYYGNVMLAVSEVGTGKVIGIADEHSINDYYIGFADNLRLADNMINWIGVRYPHDLAVSVRALSHLQPGDSTILEATVYNSGLSNETDVELQMLINGDTVANVTILNLITDSSYTLFYPWSPTIEGTYNVTAYAVPVPGETYTVNNKATSFVRVTEPMIHPEEGQYANYLMTTYNQSGQMPSWMKWNFTYQRYVTPYSINVTMVQQDSSGYNQTQWVLVNTLTREMTSGYYPLEQYYFGWIETNITTGSTIRLLDTNGTVKGSQLIEAAGTYIDCWIVEMIHYSGYYTYNYTMWYDKATGLWIGMRFSNDYYPNEYSILLLVDTNIPVGGALRIETDKPMYTRLEIATITTTYVIGDTPIENATVTIEVNYPNDTLYFIWTETTDSNGTATFVFFIEENASYGTYTAYASAYKLGLDPRTATTTFIVGHLEPNIEMWFEGPDVALIGYDIITVLHVQNTGNATAYNVTTTLDIPSSLTIISANNTFSGIIDPEQGVILVAILTAPTPSRHLLTASTTYTKADGTPMPPVYAEKTLVYAYHEDYPVDLTEMTITGTTEQIIVNLTITNYGDSPIQITLIASAQHVTSKLMLRSVYQTIIINPNETIIISLAIAIPSTAPSGEYIVLSILATQLPSQDGFTLVTKQETVII